MTELQNKDKVLLSFLCEKYNIEKDSMLHKAANLLLQRLWQGSICISLKDLVDQIDGFIPDSFNGSTAVGKSNETRPLIYDGENLYIQRYYVYQTKIINKIEQLSNKGHLHIITGGPGTGKTTSLASLIKNELEKNIFLAAPTGKAAFRMTESLLNKGINLQARTIHRLLGSIHLSVNFRHNKENPLDADIIAIDECSMLDIPLMAKLLDAIPENCQLFLLGDRNQLSPIEAGTVFADICAKYKSDDTVYKELTKNYRSESQEIIDFSNDILNGTINTLQNNKVKHSNQLPFNEFFNEFFNELYAGYNALIKAENSEEALESLHEFQILCAVKNGLNGTKKINRELLERAKKERVRFTPIIIIENNYTQNLFNGDVGVMDHDTAYFSDEKEIRKFPLSSLPGYEDAFAITIHKSQGSEYNSVAVVYPDAEKEDDEHTIFTRELLYTAVTRARKECYIYGSKEILLKSCERKVCRASGIK